jgi:CheY-like chemotaxis protein
LGQFAGDLVARLEDCVPKVLIAEDDLMIADIAEEILIEHGYEVCGIARTVAEAVVLAQHYKPDLAVLDLRLADGDLGTEIAAQLLPLGRLGALYATGNISQVMQQVAIAKEQVRDPFEKNVPGIGVGRDGCRTPMQ